MALASPTELQTTIENALRSAKNKAVAEVKGLGYFAKGTDTADAIAEGTSKLFLTADERSKIADIETLISAAVAKAKLDAHPVGSLYWAMNPLNPSQFLGGTWEQIKDKFVLAAGDTYMLGQTGGEATHTLVESELPKLGGAVGPIPTTGTTVAAYGVFSKGGSGDVTEASSTHEDFDGLTIQFSAGGGQAHNNMPPYLVAYCWKRTA